MAILFRSDWTDAQGRPTAVVHRDTANASFLRIATLYHKAGIKNALFPLALLQPDLAKYDPHNLTDPSAELRMRIAYECSENIWYYLREVVRIPAPGSSVGIRFEANRGNIAMTWCYAAGIDYFGVQPRQTGKAQPLYAKIKTPTGWTCMGDVKVGDSVMAADGTVTKVIGVYPQGPKKIYRVTFEDGRHTDCCEEHLWKVYNRYALSEGFRWQVRSLKEIIQHLASIPAGVESGLYIPRSSIETAGDLRLSFDPNDEAGYPPLATLFLRLLSVDYVGVKDAQCIEVAHPDHLYITDDFIVTHNTVGAIVITSHNLYFRGRNFKMAMLAQDTSLRHENVSRLKSIRDNLPPWMIQSQTSDIDNKEGIRYDALGNEYHTYVGRNDREGADRLGRGMSVPSIHFEELGFVANIRITYPVIKATTTAVAALAKAAGQPYSNLYTTTAARTDSDSGSFAFGVMNGAMPFTERLYDSADQQAALTMVKTNSTNNIVNGTWSYLQLGKTHEWFVDTIAAVGATEEEIERDFLNMWKAGSQQSLLSAATITKLKASQVEPSYTEVVYDDYVVSWYVPEKTVKSAGFKAQPFIIGMDSSENIGQDFTTLTLLDPSTLKVIATFRCNESNNTKLGVFIGNLLVTYPKAVFVPERKSTGMAIIDTVIMILQKYGYNPFYRIFNQVVQNREKDQFSGINLNDPAICDTAARKYLGFVTDGPSRKFLYKNVLNKAMQLNASRVYDATLISELSCLAMVNGRVDHAKGGHDDSVISYLLANWLLYEGRNLHLYGLDVNRIMSDALTDGTTVKDKDYVEGQLRIRKSIQHFKTLVETTNSPTMKSVFRHKIQNLRAMLDDSMVIEPVVQEQVALTMREFGNIYSHQKDVPPMPVPRVDNQYLQSVSKALF